MNKIDIIEPALIEMGKRVGLDWKSFQDVLDYQVNNGIQWYLTQQWTKQDEKDFAKWLTKYIKERTAWSKYKIQCEVHFFILSYGWKTKRG